MSTTPLFAAAAIAALCATPVQASGVAEVQYQQPEQFTDAGFGSVERERTQTLLIPTRVQ